MEDTQGVTPGLQLVFGSQYLDDDLALADYNIQNNSAPLHLMPGLLGGMPPKHRGMEVDGESDDEPPQRSNTRLRATQVAV